MQKSEINSLSHSICNSHKKSELLSTGETRMNTVNTELETLNTRIRRSETVHLQGVCCPRCRGSTGSAGLRGFTGPGHLDCRLLWVLCAARVLCTGIGFWKSQKIRGFELADWKAGTESLLELELELECAFKGSLWTISEDRSGSAIEFSLFSASSIADSIAEILFSFEEFRYAFCQNWLHF